MDPVEKIGAAAASTRSKFVDIQREEFERLGVFGDWDNPYLTMAPAYQARDRARVRTLRRSRARLQGAEARALVHALQDRARPGRGRVRGAAHAVGVREVPARPAPRWPAALAGARPSPSSGRPRRGRCRRTSPSPCIPTRSTSRSTGGGETLHRGGQARLEDVRGCSASCRGRDAALGRRCADPSWWASSTATLDRPHGQGRRRRVRRDGRGHRPRPHRARPRRGGLRPRPRARPADLQPGRRRRTLHRRDRALRRADGVGGESEDHRAPEARAARWWPRCR